MSRVHQSTTLGASALLALALVATPSGLAGAASVAHAARVSTTSGVVIARDLHRHTIVVADSAAQVRTIRVSPALAAKSHVGETVKSRTTLLADGTYHATSLTPTGHADKARVRATVVATRAGSTVLSSDGSVFKVKNARAAHAISPHDSTSTTGTEILATVALSQGSLDMTTEQVSGQTNLISLNGVLSAVTSTSITVAVESGANTTIAIPASLTLPSTIALGDSVELLVDYSNQTFTLVTIKDDSLASNDQGQGVAQGNTQGDSQNLEVSGTVVAQSATSLTVQPGEGAASVTFSVGATTNTSAATVGTLVDAQGSVNADGTVTLTSLDVQTSDNQDQTDQTQSDASGTITAISPTSVTLSQSDSSAVITAAIPLTLDLSSLAVGDSVHLTFDFVAGVLTVTNFEVQS